MSKSFQSRFGYRSAITAILISIGGFSSVANAATINPFTQNSTGTYSWNDLTNWSSGAVPVPTDVAAFAGTSANTLTVTLDAAQTVYGVKGLTSGAIMNITAGTGGTLTLLSTDAVNSGTATFTAINATTGTANYSAPIVLGNASTTGGTVTINSSVNSTNLNITGGISNFAGQTWGLNVTGTSTGIVNYGTVASTYNGDTTISSGSLRVNNDNMLPSGAGKGNLIIQSGATFTNNNTNLNINGLSGAGTFARSGSNTKGVTLGNGDASGNFTGNFTNGGGSSSLTKTGSGTQTFGGAVTVAAGINANAGTLNLNGNTAAGTLTVASGATLGGTGTTTLSAATGTPFTANGAITPATAGTAGAMNVSSTAATLSATSSVNVDIGGATAGTTYDQLNFTNAAGAVTLVGGSLNVSLVSGFTPTASDVYYILTRADAGSYTGAFANAPDGSTITIGAYTAQVSYSANWTGAASTDTTGGNDIALYNFQSAVAAPEPASLALLSLGAAALLARRRRI